MKELYIDVAKNCGGNSASVEKAIRDAIVDAYQNGNEYIWQMYFQYSIPKQDHGHPSNEVFIARIARAVEVQSGMFLQQDDKLA